MKIRTPIGSVNTESGIITRCANLNVGEWICDDNHPDRSTYVGQVIEEHPNCTGAFKVRWWKYANHSEQGYVYPGSFHRVVGYSEVEEPAQQQAA